MAAETSFRARRITRHIATRRRLSPTALVAGLNYTFAVCVAIILWDAPRDLQRVAAVVVLLTTPPAVVWMRRVTMMAAVRRFVTRVRQHADETDPRC